MGSRGRDAVSTIKGYYYQFDHYILQLLSLQNDSDSVRIEGIEDVDIILKDTINAVQCKYYDETSCSPSVIGKAIRPMLRHFAENKGYMYKYSLYGHYKSGQDSIVLPLTVEYVKGKFLTYTEQGIKHKLHVELNLNDADLETFISRLELQLCSDSYEGQIERIICCLQSEIHCSEYDARYFFYNNAVSFVKSIVVNKTPSARTITKKRFIEAISKKKPLFDKWYIEFVGFEKYYKDARKEFFTQTNISPKHRFFLLDCDTNINDSDLSAIIIKISEKWSKLSQREKSPYCPYIYLHGITSARLASVKRILLENEFHIWDGYEFKDADFSPISLARGINYHIGIRAKIVNKIDQINLTFNECHGQKEIFQFYLNTRFYNRTSALGKDIQIQNTIDVLKIV